ncbi:hypothetical protein [Fusobacterium sp. PH5-44]|uniref:hypothetical protein n=1 Tax=unclassified Fusobacterium TaxID=2648384 RepID=UPI003D226803
MKLKSSIFNLIKCFIGILLVEAILGGILFFLISTYTPLNQKISLIILIVFGVIMALLTLKSKYVTLEFTEDGKILMKHGSQERVINLKDYVISSNVINHYTNGIKTHTERFMVLDNGITTEEVKVDNFSKKDFEKIFSFIGKTTVNKIEVMKTISEKEFTIPREKILNDSKKFVKKFFLIGIILFLVLAGGMFFMMEKSSLSTKEVIFMTITGIIPFGILMVGIVGICIFYEHKKKIRKTPSTIRINKDFIQIDDNRIPMSTIESIRLTPSTYTAGFGKNAREMIIIFNDKNKKEFYLGLRSPATISKTIFLDYAEMCDMLQDTSLINNIEFIYDL